MKLITIVDDEAEHKRICDLASKLHKGVDCLWVKDLRSFNQIIEELNFHLVCHWMTGGRPAGISTWTKLANRQPNVRIILLDRKPSQASYRLANKIGAVEVVTRSNLSQLSLVLKREIRAVAGANRSRKATRTQNSTATQARKALTKVRKPRRSTSSPASSKTGSARARSAKAGNPKTNRTSARSAKARNPKTNSTKARSGTTNSTRARSGDSRTPTKPAHPASRTARARAPTAAKTRTRTRHTLAAKDWKPKADKSSLPPLVNYVNEALEKDDFELVYQPIMEVWDDSIDNYEVLVRLKQGPKLLLPHQFFPPAEKYGLMTAIDCWVVEHAIARLNKAEDQRLKKAKRSGTLPRRIRFFINISGYSLVDKAVLSKLVKTMVAAKASPERIVLDVDERTVLSRMANASMLSRNIKKLKLEFALNHYTGQDNLLNYLKYMSIDYVKLKSDLIKDLEQSQRRKKLVNVIVERARANGIKTMACTVESMATMSYLYHIGFDYLQGYAVAHPSDTLRENVFRELVLSPSV